MIIAPPRWIATLVPNTFSLKHSQEVLFGTVTIDTLYSDERIEVYSNGV